MQLRFFFASALALALVPACSAIIAPDTTRLGGADGGPSVDAGRPNDTGVIVDGGPGTDGGPGRDGGGTCPASCDDGVACTVDACDSASSSCTHTPNDAACGDGQRCAAAVGCVAMQCASDAECSDGDACNGAETCHPGTAGADPRTGCVAGTAPTCDDGVPCTLDSCAAATGCVHATNDALCDDTFACTTDTCSLDGCRYVANDALCNGGCLVGAICQVGAGCVGGRTSDCPPDGNPCTSDPTTCDVATGTCQHPPRDDDGDGFAIAVANGSAGTVMCDGNDCDDMDPNVFPGADEICNGVDDNCDGNIDEGGVCGMPGPDNCGAEAAIVVSRATGRGSVTATTVGDRDDYQTSSCGGTGGADAQYYVDIPGGLFTGAVDVTFSTESPATTFDTTLGTLVGGSCPGSRTGYTGRCNDDIVRGSNIQSRVTVCVGGSLVSTGTRVHVLVDGFQMGDEGNYQLDVAVTPHAGACP